MKTGDDGYAYPTFERGFDTARVLSGREERAHVQKILLSARGVSFLLQISLNIPGLPKDLPESRNVLPLAAGAFAEKFREPPGVRVSLSNGAGRAEIFSFGGDAVSAKASAVEIEEGYEWGRIIDADVITPDGPLSRSRLGVGPRRCLLCDESAKICARARAHGVDELRAEVRRLARLALRGALCP